MTNVAIVIPTLNRAALLRSAIASALRAEPDPDEVLVVDCSSADNTREVVRSFGDDVELIERRLPNAGSARNVGLAATRSPYVGFLDSDDEALQGKTGGLAAVLDASPDATLVHGAMEIMTGEGEPLPRQTAQHSRDRAKARRIGTSYPALASFCSMYTSATLIRRSAVEEIGGYDESLDTYEDWDLYLRLSLIGRLVYEEVPAARYRVWTGNVPWDHTARGIVAVARKHLAMLDAVPPDQGRAAQAAFHRRLAGSFLTLVELREARRQAIEAVRLHPRAALASSEVRRVFTRSLLPASVLERRRPPRSST
jgi:GT2 family glycosyltransferase